MSVAWTLRSGGKNIQSWLLGQHSYLESAIRDHCNRQLVDQLDLLLVKLDLQGQSC